MPDNVQALRAGQWNKKEFSKSLGLYGRTIGLLGVGAIGQEVVRRAAGFGLTVVIWSRRFDGADRPMTEQEARDLGIEGAFRMTSIDLAPTPADVAARVDILSLHLALSPETRGIVSEAVLSRLKPGAMIINTARGDVIDHDALRAAIDAKGLKVGLDVFPNEPTSATGAYTHELLGRPGVYGTHHIGASTEQAQEAIAAETVRIVRSYKETGRVPNVVNLATRTPATHMLVVRHRDRPGVLAHVFAHLRQDGLNVQETENIVFEGAQAAVARINLDGEPLPALCDRIKSANDDILDLQVVPL